MLKRLVAAYDELKNYETLHSAVLEDLFLVIRSLILDNPSLFILSGADGEGFNEGGDFQPLLYGDS